MNLSYNWLRSMVPGLINAPELAERLAGYGAPVDELTHVAEGLERIVIGRVLEATQHPNADRLRVCKVDAGTGEVLNVVCGAPNVRAGGVYPFAPVGAGLPDGMVIRQAKIRGELSQGMLCSAKELGLGRDHTGILELHGDFAPGASFVESVGLDDVRLTIDVTANRPDLLSHIGVAREIATEGVVLPGIPGAPADAATLPVQRAGDEGSIAGVRVSIRDPEACPRYIGAVIRGVALAPSPEWLASRLRAIGARPINNVVDATNYVLHELGQPLHAFDLNRLKGPEIIVRRAAEGETIVTLDGETRELTASMLVIADAESPVAVAGVMGGEESEVGDATTDVFLECALFDPRITRATRRSLGMSTDASYRFERGVDPDGMETAIRRAIDLIVATAGGAMDGGLLDVAPAVPDSVEIDVRLPRIRHVLGRSFATTEVERLLSPLGFRVAETEVGMVRVVVPGARRYDVTREIDVIEEIARRFGYDEFDADLQPYRASSVPDDPMFRLEDRLRTLLVGRGFLEARSLSFAPESEGVVPLLNPLAKTEGYLRSALLPGLVHRLEHNFSHGVRNVRLFEIGTAFAAGDEGEGRPLETTRIAGVFTGLRTPPHWSGEGEAYDIWDLKALLVELVRELGAAEDSVVAADGQPNPWLEPAGSLQISRAAAPIGYGGRVAPAKIDAPAWAGDVWGFEVVLSREMADRPHAAYVPLPAYPGTGRDLALLLPAGVTADRVTAAIRAAGGPLLEDVAPFDVYSGPGVPEGRRSVAFRLAFRAPDRTLTDEDADRAVEKVLRRLREELDVERRG